MTIDKKRKERHGTSEEEFYTSIKKKCMDDSICVVEPVDIKLCEDSVLLSTTRDLEDTCSNFKENKILSVDAQSQKVDKRGTSATLTMENKCSTTMSQNPASAGSENVSEDNNGHVLKESQDLNTVAPTRSLSSAKAPSHETKLPDLKKVESHEDLPAMNGGEFDDLFDQEWRTDAQIDLTTLQRCKVIDVKHEPRTIVLTVRQVESSEEEAVDTVACSGFWRDARVKIDDIVTIQARRESQRWIVDNDDGFLVTQPDTLISGTTITSALFCNRRAVLSERFRKIESLPNQNADYSVMTVGSLVHQWLQKALRENVHTLSDVIKLLDDMLRSKDTIEYLYASELSLADCRKRMMEYAPRIFEFIQHYIRGNEQQRMSGLKDNFRGSIHRIRDIEESVWVPKLGIKGRIDVTAEVSVNSRRRIMPLEVKTGRVTYSLEHKGQVILYLMMMGFRDREIDAGLLLYLKENAMQEIGGGHHERRDLIILRNTLAHYFVGQREEDSRSIRATSESDLRTMELPEPINHRACVQCPYRTLCCAYLTRDPSTDLASSHPLTPLVQELLNDFESSHLDYVMKWIALLQLEESSESGNGVLSNIWTTSPEKREAKRTCICNLKLVGKVVERDGRYRHAFTRVNIKGETVENGAFGDAFTENDYIIVGTDAQIHVATGHMMHLTDDTVTVLLDKDVARGEDVRDATFHIDKYPSTGSLFTYNYANVAGLLNDDEASARLRRIVVDRRPATFAEKVPRSVVSASAEIMSDLNEDQQRAVLKAVAANEYILIKGMPGTGKTQTLVALIELLLELGSTVLITAHTHSAVDNVLLKLLDRNIDFLRLGATKQIHPLLTCKTEEYATSGCDTPESLEALYNGKRIIGVTCYGAYHPLLRRREFDVCLVDESAQIMQPTVLRPLYSARRFVLVGDPDQLPPVVRSRAAVKLGADESLFVRLDGDNNTVNLTKQYRMNGRIMKLANDAAYRGKLVSGNRQVENATLISSKNVEAFSSCEEWAGRALSRHLDDSVVLLDTGNTYNLSVESHRDGGVKSDQVYSNVWEAAIVARLVRVLADTGVHARNIGVIAPYNAHVNLLRKIVDNEEVEVNTVDQYQGRDKDVVLYSCARSMERETKKEFEILNDQRRLTVAITRARHKLIVIADKVTLTRYAPFKNLFDFIDEKNVIDLRDGEEEFSWKSLVRSVL